MPKILVGPLLGVESDTLYTVCFLLEGAADPRVQLDDRKPVAPKLIAKTPGGQIWRAEFTIEPGDEGGYHSYHVQTGGVRVDNQAGRDGWKFYVSGRDERVRIAYASCNGFSAKPSNGDHYALWSRMCDQHEEQPFSLLIMGGDQLYADEIWKSERTPIVAAWSELSRRKRSEASVPPGLDDELDAFYESLYRRHWAKPAMADIMATVPSVMMWDDHDIFDGYGSYPSDLQECAYFGVIYRAARRYFEMLQLRSTANTTLLGVPNGHYSFGFRFRGHTILGLDNRSDRSLHRVMSDANWGDVKGWMRKQHATGASLLVLSAAPVLFRSYKRAEALLGATPWHEELEDDVYDQWNTKSHEGERLKLILNLLDFKKQVADAATGTRQGRVVILSGDVHVGSLGLAVDKRDPAHPRFMHQIVSSAIVHPPPTWMQWQGVRATTTDQVETLERGLITTENIEPMGSEKFIRARNYATLQVGSGGKLWVEWVCEDGRRREHGIADS